MQLQLEAMIIIQQYYMLLSSKLFQKQASFLAQMTISTALLSCDMFPVVEQLPTITAQTSGSLIALPYDENFLFKCEAKGNPRPTWVRCPALKNVRKTEEISRWSCL